MPAIQLKPLFEKKVDPVTEILRDVFKDNNYALSFLGALSIGIGVSQSNNINAQDDVEEVIVTASKKEQNIQDVPMAVQAISSAELEAKNIKSLEDIGVEHDEIKASAEYDPKLEEAINTVFEDEEESDGYGEDD